MEAYQVNNGLRDYYLKAFSIVQYVPKTEEASVPEYAAGDANAVLKPSEQAPSVDPVLRLNKAKPPSDLVDAKDIGLLHAGEVMGLLPEGPLISAVETAIEVKFGLWQPAPELLVLIDIALGLPNSEQLELLKNLLLAVDIRAHNLAAMDIVEWPPLPNMEGNEAQVREFLSTLIDTRIAQSATCKLLLLGELTCYWVMSLEHLEQLRDGRFQRSDGIILETLPSLQEMLQEPQQKRRAWQVLQP